MKRKFVSKALALMLAILIFTFSGVYAFASNALQESATVDEYVNQGTVENTDVTMAEQLAEQLDAPTLTSEKRLAILEKAAFAGVELSEIGFDSLSPSELTLVNKAVKGEFRSIAISQGLANHLQARSEYMVCSWNNSNCTQIYQGFKRFYN
jgi:hypothetical protein